MLCYDIRSYERWSFLFLYQPKPYVKYWFSFNFIGLHIVKVLESYPFIRKFIGTNIQVILSLCGRVTSHSANILNISLTEHIADDSTIDKVYIDLSCGSKPAFFLLASLKRVGHVTHKKRYNVVRPRPS